MENYEQKYKEALKIMESLHSVVKYQSSSDALLTSQTIEKAFPELRESEDEKIRKEIILFLKEGKPYYCPNSVRRQEWANWLEKQGCQKSTWNEEDEKMVSGLISIVEDWYNNQSEEEKEYYGDCGYVNFLKSIKERVRPQPKQEWRKDLPKWKKITEEKQNYIAYGYLSNDEYYLSIKELIENLPKEK